MVKHPIEAAIKEAHSACRNAQDVRDLHARSTPKGNEQREEDLQMAMYRVKRAMKPLRSFLGAAPYKADTEAHREMIARVSAASKALQKQRRKLWKMQQR